MWMWSHFSQRATWPPSAAVRQRSIADITFSWPRLTWPALALRHAGPSARKISATSRAGRATRAAASGGRRHDEVLERARDLADGPGGDLGVERRGVELLVPEQDLDHADVDLLLEQMGGEAVPKRVQRDALVDPSRLSRGVAGTVELACRQRVDRVLPGRGADLSDAPGAPGSSAISRRLRGSSAYPSSWVGQDSAAHAISPANCSNYDRVNTFHVPYRGNGPALAGFCCWVAKWRFCSPRLPRRSSTSEPASCGAYSLSTFFISTCGITLPLYPSGLASASRSRLRTTTGIGRSDGVTQGLRAVVSFARTVAIRQVCRGTVRARRLCRGQAVLGFWDHWVPNANDATETLIKEWAEKEKVEVQIDFITTQGNKLLLTGAAEAQARSGHDILAFTTWLPSRYADQLDAGQRPDGAS